MSYYHPLSFVIEAPILCSQHFLYCTTISCVLELREVIHTVHLRTFIL
jgi:hypothetical protein